MTLAPVRIAGDGAVTGTVSLNAPAPAGGVVVALAAADSTFVGVPPNVTVPASNTSATFQVKTKAVRAEQSVSITATAGAVKKTATVFLTPPPQPPPTVASLTIAPASVKSGARAMGTITLSSAAPARGFIVSLSSADTAAARVPETVTVKGGDTSAQFPVAAGKIETREKVVTISATAGDVKKTATLSVQQR
jgi:hypothetical protein